MTHPRQKGSLGRGLTRGLLFGIALVASGCPEKKEATPDPTASSCAKDTDCKGDRICKGGACVDPPAPPGAQAQPGQAGAPTQAPGAPQGDPNTLAADGLPTFIPTPGSTPPTLAEWNAVTREVTVRGSSALGCETKMLREWLRVSCKTNGGNTPTGVQSTKKPDAVQAYVFQGTGVSSVVVQVVRAQEYRASFSWSTSAGNLDSVLIVQWPAGAPRPSMYFEK